MKPTCLVLCALFVILVASDAIEARKCDYKGESLDPGTHKFGCLQVICQQNGKIVETKCPPEPLILCQTGYNLSYRPEDPTKPFPQCCGRPICVK